jgi:1,4-alpha-glucan branching enzyme
MALVDLILKYFQIFQFFFLGHGFSGSYNEYFGLATDTESFNYLQLANYVAQKFFPECITVAEVYLKKYSFCFFFSSYI